MVVRLMSDENVTEIDPDTVLDTVLETFREEYSEIDIYPSEVRLGDQPTESCELDFVCHELIGSAFLRAVAAPDFTMLVLYQGADMELDDTQPLMEKINKSLLWDTDDLLGLLNPEDR